jgi:hypothetical protein
MMTISNLRRALGIALAAAALAALPAERAQAQENFFGFSWVPGMTTGDTNSYIGQFSWRGASIDFRRFPSSNYSFGFTGTWQVFHENSFETEVGSIQDQPISGAVSGQQYRYINAFPFLLTAHYYLGSRLNPRIFVGGGAGAYWVERRTEMGLYAFTNSTWHFGASPEIGAMIPVGTGAYLYLKANYHWTTKSSDLDYQFFGFSVGFAGMSF